MNRRNFIAAAAAAATSGAEIGAAADGPIRSQPLHASYWGTQYYDDHERNQLEEVLSAQSPFRWYRSRRYRTPHYAPHKGDYEGLAIFQASNSAGFPIRAANSEAVSTLTSRRKSGGIALWS